MEGSLEPLVQATMSAIGGTITDSDGEVYKKYRIQGSAKTNGSASYALLIGVVVCSDDVGILRVREDSVILAQDTNVYDTVASAMNFSVLVKNALGTLISTTSTFIADDTVASAMNFNVLVADGSGNLISTSSTFIADDNTISAPEDHWFTLVMTAGSTFEATVVIDFTIAVPETATIEFFN